MDVRTYMRAARFHGPGASLRLEEVPRPEPRPDEVLVRVLAAGLCHTDLQFLAGTLNFGVVPLTLGHEVAGEVVALGQRVHGLRTGDRVVAYYYQPCGDCTWCRGGAENLCPDAGPQLGFSADGGFAEYVRVPARSLVPLPAALDAASAATLACSGSAALHAVRAIGQVQLGETAVVYGVGAVGLAAVQLARLSGARVLVVGRSPEKLRLARELGADLAVDASVSDPIAEVLRFTGNEGADVVFDLVGSAETMANTVPLVRRRGRLVFVGYSAERFTVNPLHLILRETRVLAALGNTRDELVETLALAAAGRLRPVVSVAFPLDSIDAAVAALRAGQIAGRGVILPNGVDVLAVTPGPSLPANVDPATMTTNGPHSTWPAEVATAPAYVLEPGPALGGALAHRSELSAATSAPESVPTLTPSLPDRTLDSPVPLANTFEAANQPSVLPAIGAPLATAAPVASTPSHARAAQSRLGPDRDTLERRLLDLISSGVDQTVAESDFNDLALQLFSLQFLTIEPYRRFCEARARRPSTVTHWREIPAIPIGAFKETTLFAGDPAAAAAVFMSSGTTQPEHRSRHYHAGLRVYDLNARLNFQAHVLPDGARLPLFALFAPPTELPSSSLAHWLDVMLASCGGPRSGWYLTRGQLDAERLAADLETAQRDSEPVGILAASFALVHFLDWCEREGRRFDLPVGSRVMDTGGYKGKSRELPKEELYAQTVALLGVPTDAIVGMYGMTEHSTQFLDATLRDRLRGISAPRYKLVPPWARTVVVDSVTLDPVPTGERGLLLHLDLANYSSVSAVLSEDVGFEVGGGFELVGRAKGAEARGCSIAVDELLCVLERGE